MKKIECFKASDGTLFERYEDAQSYEEKRIIEDELRIVLNASIKESTLKDVLAKNYQEGTSFKDLMVNYLAKIMLRDKEAFRDALWGGLEWKSN